MVVNTYFNYLFNRIFITTFEPFLHFPRGGQIVDKLGCKSTRHDDQNGLMNKNFGVILEHDTKQTSCASNCGELIAN